MTPRMDIPAALLASLALLASPTAAAPPTSESDAEQALDADSRLFVEYRASAWAPAFGGDLELPGGDSVDLERVSLDDPEASPFAEAHFKKGRLRVSLSGFRFSLDQRGEAEGQRNFGGLALQDGERFDGEIDFSSAQATAGAQVWRRRLGVKNPDQTSAPAGRRVDLSIDLYGGLRGYRLDADVRRDNGESADADDLWIEPIGGGRLKVDVAERFELDLALDGGGFSIGDRSSFSFDIVVGAQYRVTPNIGVQVGWRQLLVDLSSDDGGEEFGLESGLAGLFGGVVIRF